MGLLDGLLSRFGYVNAKAITAEQLPTWLLDQAQQVKWTTGEVARTAEQQATLYTKLTWIATAIDHVAEHSAGYEYNVKRREGEDLTDIPNHPYEMLLHSPNPLQSRFEFSRDLFAWYKATGNALIWLNRGSEQEPPAEMWMIPSHLVKPVPDGQMYLKGYIFDAGSGHSIPLETWEVCHVKTFNPLNPFWGLSAVQQLAVVAQGDLAQQAWNTKLFDKDNAKIPGALAFASMIQNPDWERLKDETKDNWGGTNRKGPLMLRGVGTGGVHWLQMALSQKEMEFLASRKATWHEVAGKLAPGLASVLDVNATEANAIAGKAILMEFAIWPMLQAIGSKMSKTILPAYGDDLVGEYDDPRQTNQLAELKEQDEYSRTHTIDEIRLEYYGDDEMGDERGQLLLAEVVNRGMAAYVAAAAATRQPGAVNQDVMPENVGSTSGLTPQGTGTPPVAPAPTVPGTGTSALAAGVAAPAAKAELAAWERFALARLGKKNARDFEPHATPLLVATRIKMALKSAHTEQAIRRVFEVESELADAAAELKRFNDAFASTR